MSTPLTYEAKFTRQLIVMRKKWKIGKICQSQDGGVFFVPRDSSRRSEIFQSLEDLKLWLESLTNDVGNADMMRTLLSVCHPRQPIICDEEKQA